MKFEDKRTIKNTNINVGDLIIGENGNYAIVQDETNEREYNYHLVNIDSFVIEDSFTHLKDAYNVIADCEEVIDIIPKERLKIVAE